MSASERFDQYMAHLSQGLGHADNAANFCPLTPCLPDEDRV